MWMPLVKNSKMGEGEEKYGQSVSKSFMNLGKVFPTFFVLF